MPRQVLCLSSGSSLSCPGPVHSPFPSSVLHSPTIDQSLQVHAVRVWSSSSAPAPHPTPQWETQPRIFSTLSAVAEPLVGPWSLLLWPKGAVVLCVCFFGYMSVCMCLYVYMSVCALVCKPLCIMFVSVFVHVCIRGCL